MLCFKDILEGESPLHSVTTSINLKDIVMDL